MAAAAFAASGAGAVGFDANDSAWETANGDVVMGWAAFEVAATLNSSVLFLLIAAQNAFIPSEVTGWKSTALGLGVAGVVVTG